jgi:hypothetical protein
VQPDRLMQISFQQFMLGYKNTYGEKRNEESSNANLFPSCLILQYSKMKKTLQ